MPVLDHRRLVAVALGMVRAYRTQAAKVAFDVDRRYNVERARHWLGVARAINRPVFQGAGQARSLMLRLPWEQEDGLNV